MNYTNNKRLDTLNQSIQFDECFFVASMSEYVCAENWSINLLCHLTDEFLKQIGMQLSLNLSYGVQKAVFC